MIRLLVLAGGPLEFLGPIGDVLRWPMEQALGFLYHFFVDLGVTHFIGAYGLAVILFTIVIRLILFPLYQTQLRLTKKSQAEQRLVQPQLAVLRKKYKGDPTRLNTEMMALYKEHGINPLSSVAGCLPLLVQMPILIGLYWAVFFHHFLPPHADTHFLWIRDLSVPATLALSAWPSWILPALAGMTTFVQSKMMTPPTPAEQDSQAAQMAQVSSTMSLLMPVLIVYFAFNPRVGQALVLYWAVGNIFMIIQQYLINGWGQLPFLGAKSLPPAPPSPRDRNGRPRNGKRRNGKGAKVLVGSTELSGRGSRRR